MKYSLLLDSSYIDLNVALADETKILEAISYQAWQCQSEYMIKEIDKVFTDFNVDKKDLDKVVVTIGPGSFTGLRIALTIAKTIKVALPNVKIYQISSLEVLKHPEKRSVCLMNARSGRSYIGVYDKDKCLMMDQILTNEEVLKFIADHKDYIPCGDLSYLGIEGYKGNVCETMFSSLKNLKEVEAALLMKPVYLKD